MIGLHIIQFHAGFESQIHMGRTEIVNMEPNVFGQAVTNQRLVFKLVLAHINQVITTATGVVENHDEGEVDWGLGGKERDPDVGRKVCCWCGCFLCHRLDGPSVVRLVRPMPFS